MIDRGKMDSVTAVLFDGKLHLKGKSDEAPPFRCPSENLHYEWEPCKDDEATLRR